MDSGGSSRLINDSFVICISSTDYLYDTDLAYSQPSTLLLEGTYSVALLQFHESTGLRDDKDGMSFVYICCDICDYPRVYGIWAARLKLFPANTPSVGSALFLSFPRKKRFRVRKQHQSSLTRCEE